MSSREQHQVMEATDRLSSNYFTYSIFCFPVVPAQLSVINQQLTDHKVGYLFTFERTSVHQLLIKQTGRGGFLDDGILFPIMLCKPRSE